MSFSQNMPKPPPKLPGRPGAPAAGPGVAPGAAPAAPPGAPAAAPGAPAQAGGQGGGLGGLFKKLSGGGAAAAPAAPGLPGRPGAPAMPGRPGAPAAAAAPVPGAAAAPAAPGLPGRPGAPAMPGRPGAAAAAPGLPGRPGAPAMPGRPGAAAAPGRPGAPAAAQAQMPAGASAAPLTAQAASNSPAPAAIDMRIVPPNLVPMVEAIVMYDHLLVEENGYLRACDSKSVEGLQPRKQQATKVYNDRLRTLLSDPAGLRGQHPDVREKVMGLIRTLENRCAENAMLLKANMEATEKVFGVINSAVIEARRREAMYTNRGAVNWGNNTSVAYNATA